MDAFEDCHTSREKGLSDAAKDAIVSHFVYSYNIELNSLLPMPTYY